MPVYVHVCTQTHTLLGSQFSCILLSLNSYCCIQEFLPLLSQTHRYIHRKGLEDKSTHSCCSPCKAKDPLSFALSSLSLGISSGDMEVGSTFTESKEKEKCGIQIYVPVLSFSGFPLWHTMRSSRRRNKEQKKMKEAYLYKRKKNL